MITLQDLIDRYGAEELAQLTNRQAQFDAVIDEAVIDRAINDATGEVASYLLPSGLVRMGALGNVIYVPSGAIPDALLLKTCDIARFYLYENGMIDVVQTRYDNAIKWLDKVKKEPEMLKGAKPESVSNDQAAHVIPNAIPSYWSM